MVTDPLNEELTPQTRLESSLMLSDLVARIATFIISNVIVNHGEMLNEERMYVANAFLQRVTSTHLCNHKLTNEGIVFKYKGQQFDLHEEFKTMTLTRSVYEHLVMFYFIYEHPKTVVEQRIVWNYWKINSLKNLLDYDPGDNEQVRKEQEEALKEIEVLRNNIFDTHLGNLCRKKLEEWTAVEKAAQNICIEFYRVRGRADVRRVSYSMAWKYLFQEEEMSLLYRHLSMHCHPVYNGLLQYQSQALTDEGYDGIPLYLSTCFLARLCKMFLKLIPHGHQMLTGEFSEQDISMLTQLSQIKDMQSSTSQP